MVKKTVGYVRLVWTCPRCGTQNPGPQKFCNGCGAPQPEDIQFEQPAEEKLLTEAEEIAKAKAGPDVHCPYCGARNPGGAKFCGACSGDLAGAKKREAGRVLGAHRREPAQQVACLACGTLNAPDARACKACGTALPRAEPAPPAVPASSQRRAVPTVGVVLGGLLLCILAAAALYLLFGRSEEVVGQVEAVYWTRTIAVEALTSVEREAWRDEIPEGAQIDACDLEYRGEQSDPAPMATEVCGTPYTVDTGGGYAEVVQDCVYEVYDEWCTYTVQDWDIVDTVTASGEDLDPWWPSLDLTAGQRVGEQQEEYEVLFTADGETYIYNPEQGDQFAQFVLGSRWLLQVNSLGGIVSLEPSP